MPYDTGQRISFNDNLITVPYCTCFYRRAVASPNRASDNKSGVYYLMSALHDINCTTYSTLYHSTTFNTIWTLSPRKYVCSHYRQGPLIVTIQPFWLAFNTVLPRAESLQRSCRQYKIKFSVSLPFRSPILFRLRKYSVDFFNIIIY